MPATNAWLRSRFFSSPGADDRQADHRSRDDLQGQARRHAERDRARVRDDVAGPRRAQRASRTRVPARSGRSCSCPEPCAALAPVPPPGRAQRWQPRQYDVTNPPALTSVIRVPQRGHAWPPFMWTARKSRTCVSNVGGTRRAARRSRRRASCASPRTARRPPRAPGSTACGRAAGRRRGGPRRCRRCRCRPRTPGCAAGS